MTPIHPGTPQAGFNLGGPFQERDVSFMEETELPHAILMAYAITHTYARPCGVLRMRCPRCRRGRESV